MKLSFDGLQIKSGKFNSKNENNKRVTKLIKSEDYEVDSIECIKYICSNCETEMFLPSYYEFNYCPFCGEKIKN